MKCATWLVLGFAAAAVFLLPGCFLSKASDAPVETFDLPPKQVEVELSEPAEVDVEPSLIDATPPPASTSSTDPVQYWDLRLEEAMQLALNNSKVLRDLGGLVLRAPATMRTTSDPSITETDPRFGVAAALSAFDASFAASAFYEKNHRQINNQFFGGGTRELNQDLQVYQTQLTKRAATGSQFTVRNKTDFDSNNAPGNAFYSAWQTQMEMEFRQPFLQGAGVDFNRIAGPNGTPGLMSGVLLARINTDTSLADFEIGVRNFVSDVENAYWDLYFAYRELDARIAARDAALETWRRVHALYVSGRRGGEAEREAQAREQYLRFEEEVHNALRGRLVAGTQSSNGSGGGTFRGLGGIHVTERRLRLMMGVPISDGRTIRPADEPMMARINFDWEVTLVEALTRRAELRRQKWQIKRRELEMVASQNFLLPQLDTVGRYRWRGLGQDLVGYQDDRSNALSTMLNGGFQEWQLGAEFSVPLGRRRGHAAVRQAELLLAREKVLLAEQERQVVHDLSNAIAEIERAYTGLEMSYNRRLATKQQLAAVQAAFDADNAPLELLLETQRILAEADTHYFRALVEYALAVKNVEFEKGTLLDYNEVHLAEGYWPVKAYYDAAQRTSLRSRPLRLNKILSKSAIVSEGLHPQLVLPQRGSELEGAFTPPPAEPADGAEDGTQEPAPGAPGNSDASQKPEGSKPAPDAPVPEATGANPRSGDSNEPQPVPGVPDELLN